MEIEKKKEKKVPYRMNGVSSPLEPVVSFVFPPIQKKKKMDKKLGVPCQNGSIGRNIEASVIAHWWD